MDEPTVTIVHGDLFDSHAQTLVNAVNCVGVMGKGIARQFRDRFPDMYNEYVLLCHANMVEVGRPYVFRGAAGQWILNFPTKTHWFGYSNVRDISDGLEYLTEHIGEWGIESLAVPALGCGEGGLSWRTMRPLLVDHLAKLDVPVELYAPLGEAR